MVCVWGGGGWVIYVKLFSRGLLWDTTAPSFILTDKKSVTFVTHQWDDFPFFGEGQGTWPNILSSTTEVAKKALKSHTWQWKLHWVMSLPPSTSEDGNFVHRGHEEQLEKQGQSEPAVISDALVNKSFCLLYRLLNPPSQREKNRT